MINLEQVCKMLDNTLNGTNEEVSEISPTTDAYFFKVFSEGLYLSNVSDRVKGKNFIPVVIGSLGGEYNPVPYLEEDDYSIQITLFYPVRFKNDFYALNEFFRKVFVGKVLTYGTQKALSNISVAQYGELQSLDMKEFREWITRTYKEETINVIETYMSMQFTLYLNTAYKLGQTDGFVLGNQIPLTKIKMTYKGTTFLEDTTPVLIERADLANVEPAQQQLYGENYSRGFGASASFTRQLPLIIKLNTGYRTLLDYCENTKDIQNIVVEITESIPFASALTITHKYYISAYSRNTKLGDFLGVNLTLNDYKEL